MLQREISPLVKQIQISGYRGFSSVYFLTYKLRPDNKGQQNKITKLEQSFGSVAHTCISSWTTSSVLLFNFGCGMMSDETILVSDNTSSILMLESTYYIILVVGLLISALLVHWLGRRTAYIFATSSAILAWITIYNADTPVKFALGRTLGDFSNGAGIILGAMAIAEYTKPSYRPVFWTLASAAVALGQMTACFLGKLRITAIFALVTSVLSLTITYTWPESPQWLLLNKESFIWLKGTSSNKRRTIIDLELIELVQRQKKAKLDTLWNVFKNLTSIEFLKPLVLIIFADVLLEASGQQIFEVYGAQILGVIFGKYLFDYILFIKIIIACSIMCSSVLVKFFKGTTILFLSGFISVLVLLILSVILFLISNNVISIDSWSLFSLTVLYLILINLGCTIAFLNWCGELFSSKNKGFGLFLSGVVFCINKRICLKLTPYLLASLKLYGTFGLLSVVLILSLLTLYFIAPETRDKSLLEIEYYIQNGIHREEDEVIKTSPA